MTTFTIHTPRLRTVREQSTARKRSAALRADPKPLWRAGQSSHRSRGVRHARQPGDAVELLPNRTPRRLVHDQRLSRLPLLHAGPHISGQRRECTGGRDRDCARRPLLRRSEAGGIAGPHAEFGRKPRLGLAAKPRCILCRRVYQAERARDRCDHRPQGPLELHQSHR